MYVTLRGILWGHSRALVLSYQNRRILSFCRESARPALRMDCFFFPFSPCICISTSMIGAKARISMMQ